MFITNGLFSSESVSVGHPDKLADQISDAVLDEFLKLDSNARVACETFLADQKVIVAGEFKTTCMDTFVSIRERVPHVVSTVIRDAGYTTAETGIDPDRCEIQVLFNHQSPDIAMGVDLHSGVIGAGDQGLMFGYACNETEHLMPAPVVYAHRLLQKLEQKRRSGEISWLQPDAKSQVTFQYENGQPVAVETVVLSTQHTDDVTTSEIRHVVSNEIIGNTILNNLRSQNYQEIINPTGRFVVGGPKGDVGLTGRKIIVDTYGGAAPHGGGAFSGKDPTKVDRSGAYAARFLAKQVVARGWADKCLVQLAYAIGKAEPVSLFVNTNHTAKDDLALAQSLQQEFDLTPAGIISFLKLQQPIYYPTAVYGHFGRDDIQLPWEAITQDRVA